MAAKKQASASSRRHEARADLHNLKLANTTSSLNLKIYADGEAIGALEVGRRSLSWYGRKKQKSERIEWTKYLQMMDRLA